MEQQGEFQNELTKLRSDWSGVNKVVLVDLECCH
jgi:hypothetical protein